MPMYSATEAEVAARAIRDRTGSHATSIGIILGSGLGGLSRQIDEAVRIPFAEIPGFPAATVAGHDGQVIVGKLGGRHVVALSGRFHMYEGHPARLAGFPVRVFRSLGARELFVSNAAGGISAKLKAGDLMVISDHLNLMYRNPLIGPVVPDEIRFPDMTEAYDTGLRKALHAAAKKVGIEIKEGVYAGLLGPTYETPAEVKMLRMLGADAVGMSTVPEVIVARALGMRVAGVSCITNAAATAGAPPLNHEDVLATTARVGDLFQRLVVEFLAESATT